MFRIQRVFQIVSHHLNTQSPGRYRRTQFVVRASSPGDVALAAGGHDDVSTLALRSLIITTPHYTV